jgi:hypothetical protein
MKNKQDYVKDIAEIRSMMERSTKFMSLSGWAGIMAGMYALIGVYVAHTFLNFKPSDNPGETPFDLQKLIILAIMILVLSVTTAIFLSFRRAAKKSELVWNATSRRMLIHMALPLVSGGILLLLFMSTGQIGLLAPISLIFYGLSLFIAAYYTYSEIKYLGIILTILGLISAFYVEYGLLFWAGGFGLMHIVYGLYIHLKHER